MYLAHSSRSRRRFVAALAVSTLLVAAAAGSAHAREDAGTPAVEVEILWTDVENSSGILGRTKVNPQRPDAQAAVVARLTIRPGARLFWRTHHGPVAVSVAEGILLYRQGPDCAERSFSAPEILVGQEDRIQSLRNPGPHRLVLLATFYGVSDGRWMTPAVPLVDRCSRAGAGSTGFASSGGSIRWFTME